MFAQPIAQKHMNQLTGQNINRNKSGNEGNNDLVLAVEVCCQIMTSLIIMTYDVISVSCLDMNSDRYWLLIKEVFHHGRFAGPVGVAVDSPGNLQISPGP